MSADDGALSSPGGSPSGRRSGRLLPIAAAVAAAATVLAAWPGAERAPTPARAEVPPGQAVFAKLGCGSCHRFTPAGATGELAPDLDERVRGHTETSLRAVILDPPGQMMPDDFGRRTSDAELDALVAFLLSKR